MSISCYFAPSFDILNIFDRHLIRDKRPGSVLCALEIYAVSIEPLPDR